MTLAGFFARQARNPRGAFGKYFMSRVFDKGNAPLNTFVRQVLDLRPHEQALEIGYGTGYLIAALAGTLDSGCIHGIDLSPVMADVARKRNRVQIKAGRASLKTGDFDTAVYPADFFNAVLSVNTLYFWAAPDRTLDRIRTTLKPGGRLILGFQDDRYLEKRNMDRNVFAYYGAGDVERLLSSVFDTVEIKAGDGGGHTSYCAVALKKGGR